MVGVISYGQPDPDRLLHQPSKGKRGNDDICLPVTPVGHDMTFTLATCGTIFTFGKLILIDSTQPEDICSAVQREQVNCAVMAPALATRLVNFEGLKDMWVGDPVRPTSSGMATKRPATNILTDSAEPKAKVS